MAEVVSLHGTWQPQTEAPNETVVRELERLLDAARSGEIVGIAGAYMHKDRMVTYSYAGLIGGYSVIGALTCLIDRIKNVVMSRD